MRTRILTTALLALATACSEQSFYAVADRPDEGDLKLSGYVCDTEINAWLEGANVYTHLLDSDGVLYSTITVQSDADGWWEMDGLAAGATYTVYVQYGSTLLDMFDVTMPATDHALDKPDCAGQSELEVAVISGDYDQFEEVLAKVGVSEYDLINGTTGDELLQFLLNADALAPYDAIFFAGGHLEEDIFYDTNASDAAGNVAKVKDALRGYVEGGGAIYASDWSYDVVEQLWPAKIDFLGEDNEPGDAQKGTETEVQASVANADLETAVGASTVGIVFDLDAWPVVEAVGDGAQVYLRADVPYAEGFETATVKNSPILVTFTAGKGSVFFSSWRQVSNADGRGLTTIKFLLDDLQE